MDEVTSNNQRGSELKVDSGEGEIERDLKIQYK